MTQMKQLIDELTDQSDFCANPISDIWYLEIDSFELVLNEKTGEIGSIDPLETKSTNLKNFETVQEVLRFFSE